MRSNNLGIQDISCSAKRRKVTASFKFIKNTEIWADPFSKLLKLSFCCKDFFSLFLFCLFFLFFFVFFPFCFLFLVSTQVKKLFNFVFLKFYKETGRSCFVWFSAYVFLRSCFVWLRAYVLLHVSHVPCKLKKCT